MKYHLSCRNTFPAESPILQEIEPVTKRPSVLKSTVPRTTAADTGRFIEQ